jgi:hypothetical protein
VLALNFNVKKVSHLHIIKLKQSRVGGDYSFWKPKKKRKMEQNQQITVPYAVATLVLGIASLVFGCLFAGLVTGIVGLVLGNKGKKAYKENPSMYKGYGMLNAGWICSIVGVILGAITIIWWLIAAVILGGSFAIFDLLGM